MMQKLKDRIPVSVKVGVTRAAYRLADLGASLFGLDDELTPPRALRPYVGPGDYRAIGQAARELLIEAGRLRPESSMLDIGCGPGRIAVPLTTYLGPEGRYCGFDIMEEAIDWCRARITPRFENFRFEWCNVYSKFYNPKGNVTAKEYRFPYEDGSFDVVLASSVFTHMLIEDTDHYLAEISRVLRPGGRCIATFFLLDDAVEARIDGGAAEVALPHEMGRSKVHRRDVPEYVIAHPESDVLELVAKQDLILAEPIRYGSWSGRDGATAGQDVVILTRAES